MIKLILILLYFLIFFIVSIPTFVVLAIIGKFNKNLKDRISFAMVIFSFKVIIKITGAKMNIIGRERIPTDTPVLYVANHRSFFDVVIGYTQVLPLCGFVSKIEIKKVPILAHWMVNMNCLFLDRDNIKEGMKMILQGVDNLKNGISMFIFPEGTRGKSEGELMEFKEGSMKMAEKAKVPIVPVAFSNTSSIFENQFPRIKAGSMVMEFGEPIYPEQLDKEQRKHLGAYTHDIIQGMLDKNKSLLK